MCIGFHKATLLHNETGNISQTDQNMNSIPYNANYLMSPTHCIIIDTNADGRSHISNDNDRIYAGNERRIIRRVCESLKGSDPSELVKYDVKCQVI